MAHRPAAHTIRTLAFAALLLTLGLVLPFLTGQIPQFGSMLLPMHLPVLLCGFVCSWPWGLAVGAVTPLLRSLLFAMPPMFPTALAMAFELAAYGCCTGLLYRRLPRNTPMLYVALVVSMLVGRIVWAAATYCITGAMSMQAFLAGAFLNAWPGIIAQLLLVPPLVLALRRVGFSE